ncbi:hypothetical protein MJH12_18605 [bacterium]|nr:hypothetical protein [bacterium]
MPFAFSLHPRPSKDQVQLSKDILKELDNLIIHPLLKFIQNNDVSDMGSQYVMQQLVSNKWNYYWIFSIPEIYEYFMDAQHSDATISILRKFCQFNRKLPEISIYSEPYYVQNDNPLWTRFMSDLNQLGVDQNDHLFHNLRYFLEWEQYKVNTESKPLIAQILSPFYTSLKLNPLVPIPFLAETLKLLLFLDPKNPKGNLEYSQLLQISCHEKEQIDFLKKAVFLPSQDKLLFLTFFSLLETDQDLHFYTENYTKSHRMCKTKLY